MFTVAEARGHDDSETPLETLLPNNPEPPTAVTSVESSIPENLAADDKASPAPSLKSHSLTQVWATDLSSMQLVSPSVKACSSVKTSVFYGSSGRSAAKSFCATARGTRVARMIRKPAKLND